MKLVEQSWAEPKEPLGAAASDGSGKQRESLAADLLFRRHHKEVLRIVRRLLGPNASQDDVEDVTQQTFISAYRSLSKFRGDSKPSTWLYRISVSAVLMHLRSWKRRKRALEEFIESWKVTRSPGVDMEARLGQREEIERAWAQLERMTAKKRIVFVLYEVEGLSCPEIAEVLGVEPATVATRLHHARKELVKRMRRLEP